MSWAKVKKGKKPLGWWYHKLMCEIGWSIRYANNWDLYYKHLAKMCGKYHINLYGEALPHRTFTAEQVANAQKAFNV